MYTPTFDDILKSPTAYAIYNGGAYEATTQAVSAIVRETHMRAITYAITDVAGLKALESELWNEFYKRILTIADNNANNDIQDVTKLHCRDSALNHTACTRLD